MVLRSWSIRTRLALLSGGLVLVTGGLLYLLPGGAGWVAVPLAAAGGWAGWLVTGRELRPIGQIAATTHQVDESNLHRRIPLAAQGELRALAGSINDMLARLDRACAGQHRFVANVAQEMRAPLAHTRDLLQAGPDDGLRTELLQVTDRQERLVDELLTLVSSEQAVTEPVPVELADIAYRVSDELEPEARRAGIELRLAARPARTPGNPVLLERLAQSLLQNAVQYNTADGWVRVATGTDGNTVRLTVTNTGPVVATGEVPALFEPFRRRKPACTVGLGLSIVRSVARAHGGQVSAAPRDGGGLVVEVTLPRSIS
jgi:signal transduction histidine kinase